MIYASANSLERAHFPNVSAKQTVKQDYAKAKRAEKPGPLYVDERGRCEVPETGPSLGLRLGACKGAKSSAGTYSGNRR
jgi:hypothetical protein